MNKLLSVLIGLSLLTAPGFAQDGKNAKGSKEGGPCGKSQHDVAGLLKKKGHPEDAARHFKERHPDGLCHCYCGHDKPEGKDGGFKDPGPKEGAPKDGGGKTGKKEAGPCGRTRAQLTEMLGKKDAKGDIGDQVAAHFKAHPDALCHCYCGHDKPEGKDGGFKEGAPKEGAPKDGAPKDGGFKQGKKEAGPCGRTSAQMAEGLSQKSFKGDIDAHVAEHFKAHPDGLCHCSCGHDKPAGSKKEGGAPPCGKSVKHAAGEEGLKHFKTQHPDGVCHCLCEHEWKGEKGGGNEPSGKLDRK